MPLIIEAPKPLTRITAAVRRELRMLFFGTPQFAVPALRALHESGWPLDLVVTAPDKPVGRRRVLTPSPVRKVAVELGLEVMTPERLTDEPFRMRYDALRPDLCLVVAYGKIIPQRFLDSARLGFLNIHPSLLPAYRGPSPIQSAILDGCAATGVSIMQLDEQMDHGPVLIQEPWIIPSSFDAPLAEDELSRLGARMLADILPAFIDGTLRPVPQQHELATYCKKFTRSDGRLDFALPVLQVSDRVRALGHNPGTWTYWDHKVLNILRVRPASGPPRPGSAIGTVTLIGDEPAVCCSDGMLVIEALQLEGASPLKAQDFVRGRPAFVGAILGT